MNITKQYLEHSQIQKKTVGSPFVAMTSWQRMGIVVFLITFLLWIRFQIELHPSSIPSLELVSIALLGNFTLLLFPIIFYQSSYGWFHPLVFNIFFAFIYHLRRSDAYILGLQWHAALPGWSAESLTLLLCYELILQSVGLLSYYSGFFLSPSWNIPKITFTQPTHLGSKVLLTVLFSASVFAVYMQTKGGIVNHILSWGMGRGTALAGEFYWQFLIQFGLIACLCWLAIDRHSTVKPMFWGCTIVSLAIVFLTGGSRSSIVYFMVMGIVVWCIREKKIALTRILIIAMIGLFLLGILGNFRNSTFSGEINWRALIGETSPSSVDESAVTTGLSEVTSRSSVFAGVFPILARVPHEVDFLRGSSYLAVLTLPIPRGLWAAKPGLVSGMVGETFFHTTAGMPAGAIGEAYWNLGIPCILLVFFLFGAFSRWLANSFVHYAAQPAAIALYVITLFSFSEPSGLSLISWLLKLVPALLFLVTTGAIALRQPQHS